MCIGEILILLSCLIPVGAGAKVSTTAYKTFITSNFGRQIIAILINKDESIIEMSGHAASEQINKNPKLGQYFPELVKDIKNSKRMILAPNQKPDAKPHITHYEVYEGKYGWHHVEVYKDGHKRFHITKDTINEGLRPTRPGDKDSANLIITDALKKVHPNNKNTPLIKLQVEKMFTKMVNLPVLQHL